MRSDSRFTEEFVYFFTNTNTFFIKTSLNHNYESTQMEESCCMATIYMYNIHTNLY